MQDVQPNPSRTASGDVPSIPPSGSRKPLLTLVPGSQWGALHLVELWHYRDLMFTLSGRDIKLRYRQTALGALWVVLQPLMAAGIFSFVFGTVAKLQSDGLPYLIFSYAGLLGWNLFSSTLSKASGCLVGNSGLISKVFFPRLVLPLSTIPSVMVDFGVSALLMAALMVYYHVVPGLSLLALPLLMLMLTMLALGIGMFASALMVSYRDVQYILPVVTQMLMYASPIAYTLSVVPQKYRILYMINPLAPLLQAFRWSILNQGEVHLNGVLTACVVSTVIFLLGLFSFKRMERRFADVI